MTGLFRRGGVWWARMVVPERLRDRAGRREFVQSTGTHEYSVGKLVAAVLLAGWRRVLYELERGRVDSEKLLRLIEGSPILGQPGYLTIKRAVDETGLDRDTFLQAVSSGRIGLYYQVGALADGHVIPAHLLAPIDPELGRSGGVVIPDADQMPDGAAEARFPGQTLRIPDGRDVAGVALTESKDCITLVALDAPSPAGWLFAPNQAIDVLVDDLALLTNEVDALRIAMAARVAPDRVEHARAERKAGLATQVLRERAALHTQTKATSLIAGKWAHKLFSWAVDQYCTLPNGLRETLGSDHEVRQRRAGILVFAEFMGDLPLAQIDAETLREFRDGPLKTFPAHANRLPGSLRCATMKGTIEALKADGRDWPLMSTDMQAERMTWLYRFFRWLFRSEGKYMGQDVSEGLATAPAVARKDRKEASRVASKEGDDEEGRRPFTDDELVLIFSQPHFKTGNGRHITKGNEVWYPFEYWLPLLGLYCGIRMSEATQLHLSDVVQAGEVWLLDINEKTADKSLKTEVASCRRIPLHPEVIRLGFVDWCAQLRLEGYRRVFPELSYTSPARYSKAAIRVMSLMLKVTLDAARDGTVVFHNLRKNANNAIARAPVEGIADPGLLQFIRYSVIGHKLPKDVNTEHYTSTTVEEMARLVNKVQHPFLPKIARFDIEDGMRWVRLAPNKKLGWRRGLKEDMGPLNDA